MVYEKPCRRPSCQQMVRKSMPSRLAAAAYCCRECGAQHRIESGVHPFLNRTHAQIIRTATKAGKTRGERARRRKVKAIAARFSALFPERWELTLDREDIARVKALLVRAYREGHEDGYQAGYTIQWRKQARLSRKVA